MLFVRLSLSVKSASHLIVFFSYNKSVNNIFNYNLLAKLTVLSDMDRWLEKMYVLMKQ